MTVCIIGIVVPKMVDAQLAPSYHVISCKDSFALQPQVRLLLYVRAHGSELARPAGYNV